VCESVCEHHSITPGLPLPKPRIDALERNADCDDYGYVLYSIVERLVVLVTRQNEALCVTVQVVRAHDKLITFKQFMRAII
jgi:hypothetical protein